MDRSIMIARELVRLAKSLVAAKVIPEHVVFEKDEVDKIQDAAEANGLETQFNVDGDGMKATISNGVVLTVRLSDDGYEYVVAGEDGDEQVFQSIDEAIGAAFE